MPIEMTKTQVVDCERILRGAGYSHAWLLDSTDSNELAFLVPESDLDWGVPGYVGYGAPLDWVAHTESPLMRETSIALIAVFPGTKVFIGELKGELPARQLY